MDRRLHEALTTTIEILKERNNNLGNLVASQRELIDTMETMAKDSGKQLRIEKKKTQFVKDMTFSMTHRFELLRRKYPDIFKEIEDTAAAAGWDNDYDFETVCHFIGNN